MRRIVVTGLMLIGAVILGSIAATRAPETSVVVAAPSQNPQPVTVTNFPTTQGVTGTVNVGNLPAVQNVAGTVAVGNLPVDADGNLRVAGGTAPPPFKLIRIFDPTVFPPAQVPTHVGPFDVAGWKRAILFINHPDGQLNVGNNGATMEYGTSGVFLSLQGVSLNDQADILITDVVMPELRVSILTTTGDTYEGWLYLSN